MRQDHGKNNCLWWKSELITKWANNSGGFQIKNSFQRASFHSQKDEPLTGFLKQKDILSSLHPEMSNPIINMKILRKCGGELENAINCKCEDPCSTED
ncbi:hypothetical protein O181_049200 [Austropuccinia psidii MF-1]|uniref:Uncharacterized protein n=1 Tax=Austropuccinia psidii MF-1 TaxID=1389203 RepID=A0A9Q3HPU5_9BASI|nr:hypothetical protein [Austropuccinia psidii MF-1]